jgi:hypothetical protein
VHALVGGDEVVPAGRLRRVAEVEAHPVGDPGGVGVDAGLLDRRLVDVEAVHGHGRMGQRQADRRPALPAAHVGDATTPLQHRGDLRDRRQEFPRQVAEEQRPVGAGLALAHVVAEFGPAHPAAGPVGREQRVDVLAEPAHHASHGQDVRRAVRIGQRLGRAGR